MKAITISTSVVASTALLVSFFLIQRSGNVDNVAVTESALTSVASPTAPAIRNSEVKMSSMDQTIVDPVWSRAPIPQNQNFFPTGIVVSNYVKVDRAELDNVEEGDRFQIWLPSPLGERDVWVESVSLSSSGNRSISGTLDGQQLYSVVITLGKSNIFATIGTEAGIYSLRGIGELAALATPTELRKVFNEKKSDIRVPTETEGLRS